MFKKFEDNLLVRLFFAEGNFLGDYVLVENLEIIKRIVVEIEVKVIEVKKIEIDINLVRENYRFVVVRVLLLYFILNDLYKIYFMY